MGAMKVRRKVRRGNSFSSERSSKTTAISSGTHPHKVLGQAKRQRRAWGQPYNRNQVKHTRIQFKCDFCEKATKIALKNGLNIDLNNFIGKQQPKNITS